jgi:hypothetical protein
VIDAEGGIGHRTDQDRVLTAHLANHYSLMTAMGRKRSLAIGKISGVPTTVQGCKF